MPAAGRTARRPTASATTPRSCADALGDLAVALDHDQRADLRVVPQLLVGHAGARADDDTGPRPRRAPPAARPRARARARSASGGPTHEARHHQPDRATSTRRATAPADVAAAARRRTSGSNRHVPRARATTARIRDDVVAVFGHARAHQRGGRRGLVQPGDLALISAPTDFAGINHYTNMLVPADADGAGRHRAWTHVQPTPTSFGWSDTPRRCATCCCGSRREFTPLPIYVTENGATLPRLPDPDGEVHDPERIALPRAATRAASPRRWPRAPTCAATSPGRSWTTSSGPGATRSGSASSTSTTAPRSASRKDSAYWYRDVIAAHASVAPATTSARPEANPTHRPTITRAHSDAPLMPLTA